MKPNEMLSCELNPDGVLHVTAYTHGADTISADRFSFNHGGQLTGFSLRGLCEFANEDVLNEFVKNNILPVLVMNFPNLFPEGLATRIVAGFCPMMIGGEIPSPRDFQVTQL